MAGLTVFTAVVDHSFLSGGKMQTFICKNSQSFYTSARFIKKIIEKKEKGEIVKFAQSPSQMSANKDSKQR